MKTMSFPSIRFRFQTAAVLLFLGQAAVVAAVEPARELNVPPEGFTALFNGKDFTGWRLSPKAKEMWFIEDGVLKSPGLLREWGADLVTEKTYRDFVLMLDFRMPTISDSGINFRRLMPEIPGFGNQEQFNLRSKGGMGHLESYHFLPKETAEKMKLQEEQKPHVRHVDPEVGVWHTVKLSMQGRTFSAEYDGEVLHDNFQYHDWMLNLDFAPIRLQKHVFVDGDNLGKMNPCPIEYRNIFIKELEPSGATASAPSPSQGEGRGEGRQKARPTASSNAALLAGIDAQNLPAGYSPANHQDYVDRRIAELPDEQRGRLHQLWQEKQRIDPNMPNRGASFVKIMTYVANGEKLPAEDNRQPDPSIEDPAKSLDATPETRSSKPVHAWKWSAATGAEGGNRKAMPLEIPEGPTIYVVSFGLLEDDDPPVVLLPESRLAVTGRLATAQPVCFGITIRHPNGDFAGRFVVVRPADEFQSWKGFHVTLDFQDFQLDSSLAAMKDKLPGAPLHFVIESLWVTTLENKAGLEIAEVELIPTTAEEAQ